VDTLGHLLALRLTPADEQDRAQEVEELARSVQEATGESVELAYADRGYSGGEASEAAEASGIRLEVVRHPGAKKGFASCCLEEVGGGALLRVGDEVPQARQGLREVAGDGGGAAHRRLGLPFPPPGHRRARVRSVTRALGSSRIAHSPGPERPGRAGGDACLALCPVGIALVVVTLLPYVFAIPKPLALLCANYDVIPVATVDFFVYPGAWNERVIATAGANFVTPCTTVDFVGAEGTS
jgi:hypothetical protein